MTINKSDIIKAIDGYTKKDFTGCIKIGIQEGVYNHISISNAIEVPTTKTAKGKDTIEYLLEMVRDNFSGTIVACYENGVMTEYAYNKTLKGESLKEFVGGCYDR